MQNGYKKLMLGVLCSSVLFLSACGDDDNNDIFVPQPKIFLSEQAYTKDVITQASSIRVMRYNMPNVQGNTAETTALVIYPRTPQPRDGWRVVVWEHGTVGSGDSCAPSSNILNPRFKIMAESLLAKGYVIVAPDYEGLGTRGIHPYFHLKSAAQSALYAGEGFKQQQGDKFNGAWVSVGQSQGGHASLGTAELAGNDPNYKAAVAAAPASSLGYMIGTVAPQDVHNVIVGQGAGVVQPGTAKAVDSVLLADAEDVGVGGLGYGASFAYRDIFESTPQVVVERA